MEKVLKRKRDEESSEKDSQSVGGETTWVKLKNNETDYLSLLIDDCLLDVLTRLDHNDLDQLSTLSKKMSNLSEQSRRNAGRIKVADLLIYQVNENEFIFKMRIAYEEYVTNMNPHKLFKRQNDLIRCQGILVESQQPHITQAITSQASTLLRKFIFRKCTFQSIAFDQNITSLLENLSLARSISSLEFDDCSFDKQLSVEGRDRFRSILISANIGLVRMNWHCEESLLSQHFLEEYSKAVVHPWLTITCRDEYMRPDKMKLIRTNEEFVNFMWKFHTFEITAVVVDSDRLFKIILKRLRLRKHGEWRFLVTRKINREEVISAIALEPDLEYLSTPYKWEYCVRISGTEEDKATFCTQFHPGYPTLSMFKLVFSSPPK